MRPKTVTEIIIKSFNWIMMKIKGFDKLSYPIYSAIRRGFPLSGMTQITKSVYETLLQY